VITTSAAYQEAEADQDDGHGSLGAGPIRGCRFVLFERFDLDVR
jgi:hypothetical protein